MNKRLLRIASRIAFKDTKKLFPYVYVCLNPKCGTVNEKEVDGETEISFIPKFNILNLEKPQSSGVNCPKCKQKFFLVTESKLQDSNVKDINTALKKKEVPQFIIDKMKPAIEKRLSGIEENILDKVVKEKPEEQ